MRQAAAKIKPRIADQTTFPAPVSGWISNVNLATPNARKPDGSKVMGATILENWFPTATGIRMRGGSSKHATVGAAATDVGAIFSYINGATQILFAADDAGIYDITTPADPDVALTAAVGSLTSGDWSVVQFATAGGTFLRLVNGVDTPLVFDGSTWGTAPALTGVTATLLINVWSFKNRLFFIESNSLNVWYLAVDSIGGALTKFPMGGIFSLGGSLLFGATWSLDTGAGLSEQCVFVTTEGEVAVFQGSDPSSSTTWTKVGVYKLGRPRGPKAFIKAGGDLVVATDIGFVALSQAIQRDIAALTPSAVSYPIEVAWNDAITTRSQDYWHCVVWPAKQMVLVAVHNIPGVQPMMFAANARTGAWAPFTGWEGHSLGVFGDRCFFGSSNGLIIEAESGGSDQGDAYTCTCVPLFDPLKTPTSLKTGLQARPVLRAVSDVEAKCSFQADYNVVLPTAPDDIVVLGTGLWGTAKWGQDVWGTPSEKRTFQKWRSVSGSGYAVSVATQITSGSIAAPSVDLVQVDLTYDIGDPSS